MTDSLINNVFSITNRLRGDCGLSETTSIEDATVSVLTHIIIGSLAGYIPVKEYIEESEDLLLVIFLCTVGTQLILYIRNEGGELSTNDVIAKAGLTIFQFVDDEYAAILISRGMEQYKKIILEEGHKASVRNYIDTVSKSVLVYLATEDESILRLFKGLYNNLDDLIG